MIKGLLIEDDIDNINSYKERFARFDIELIDIDRFPAKPEGFFDIALENDVDFIIIDNHLHKKKVPYNGINVLDCIRMIDKEIYIVYLTNNDFVEEKLSLFDLEISKTDMPRKFFDIISKIKRATSRDIMIKLERELENSVKIQQNYYEEKIRELSKLIGD